MVSPHCVLDGRACRATGNLRLTSIHPGHGVREALQDDRDCED